MERIFPHLRRVVTFAGAFGSGKTEVAVNFTELWVARVAVSIADLDIVNLYFRSRDVRAQLESRGITVLAPRTDGPMTDLPIIIPEVRGALRDGTRQLVLDVGGNDCGARVLGSFKDVMDRSAVDLFVVVNANRPFTEDVDGARSVLRSIEAASGLAVTGLVSNTHLCDETTVDTVVDGFRMAQELGLAVGAPVRFAAADARIAADVARQLPVPVLPLSRRMLAPFHPEAARIPVPGRPLGRP
ncbi:MAG: hypothetical protein HY815_24415 [Candidatus Riflebacteria bacterium]|nr:hypothetical protein [Candidatus Riflebacteria bacterium]